MVEKIRLGGNLQAEIIMVGTELLLGQIVDTNATFLAQRLAEIGLNLFYKSTVGDNKERMIEVIKTALSRSNVVITSGGLGATEDDLTRETVAKVTGRELIFNQKIMEQIEDRFMKRRIKMSPNNRKQALLPEGAIPIENPRGTAPGFIVETERGAIISLPGVPHELKYLFDNKVIPYLKFKFSPNTIIKYRVLRVTGLTESEVDERIGDLIIKGKNPTVGILAHPGDIHIRITAKAGNNKEAMELIQDVESEIRKRLGDFIFGVDSETLEERIGKILYEKDKTISVVEAGSGGMLIHRLSSANIDRLIGGIVFSNRKSMINFLSKFFKVTDSDEYTEDISQLLSKAIMLFGQSSTGFSLVLEKERTSASISTSDSTKTWNIERGGEDKFEQGRAVNWALDILRRNI